MFVERTSCATFWVDSLARSLWVTWLMKRAPPVTNGRSISTLLIVLHNAGPWRGLLTPVLTGLQAGGGLEALVATMKAVPGHQPARAWATKR